MVHRRQVAVVSPSTPHGCMLRMTRANATTQTRLRRGGCSLDGLCFFAPIAVVICTTLHVSPVSVSARPHHCAGEGGAGVRRQTRSSSASLAVRSRSAQPSYPSSFCPSSSKYSTKSPYDPRRKRNQFPENQIV